MLTKVKLTKRSKVSIITLTVIPLIKKVITKPYSELNVSKIELVCINDTSPIAFEDIKGYE